jgi:hypothetical protein
MQQIDPSFDERNAGFSRFSKFVVEAGQKGLLLVSKLENGQFEVAPVRAGDSRLAKTAAEPASARAAEGPRREREDGRRRRGRGRGRGREREEQAESGEAAPASAPRGEGGLPLARAFQLMTEALLELGGAVSDNQLRARMVALHGREDPLLASPRFARLLRQANDAEVAEVRKVGDDTYEISLARRPGPPMRPAAAAAATPAAQNGAAAGEPASAPASAPASGPAAPRTGIRFRRGSRGPSRPGEIPLIGVVSMDPPVASAEPVGPASETGDVVAKPRRSRKASGRGKAKAAAPAKEAGPAKEVAAAAVEPKPARRPRRPRAKKAAE